MKHFKLLLIIFSIWFPAALIATEVSVIPAYDEIQGGTSVVYDIRIFDVNVLEGFDLRVTYSATDFADVSATVGDFLSSNPNDLQFIADYSTPGEIFITCTLLNGQNGASGNGVLAHLHLTSQMINHSTGSPITLFNVELRNIYNQTIPCTTNNAIVVIDSEAPKFNNNDPLPLTENQWYNEAPVIPATNFVFSDNFNLHSVDQKVDNNTWQEIATGINGLTYPDPPQDYTLSNFFSLAEGAHTLQWQADDDVEHTNQWSWAFNKDTEPPQGILSLDFNDITIGGFTLSGGILNDASQGEVFYEFDEVNDLAPDRGRVSGANTYTLTGLTANTPYTFRYRGSDGVTNNQPPAQWDQECNYTDWSIALTRYTLSTPPSNTTVTCDKSISTWYTSPEFVFTAVGGFGEGAPVSYYRFVWNREATHTWSENEPVWNQSNSVGETMTLTAGEDGDNWYLHLKGYNGENAPNGTFDFGPFYCDATAPCAIHDFSAVTTDNSDESVTLSWTNPQESISAIHIYARPFGNDGTGTYPFYDGTAPTASTWNNLSAEFWTEVGTIAGTETQFIHSPAARNEWYYLVFTEDPAGNISPASLMEHALSYWLGDVNTPADGIVNSNDIGLLAASWNANGLVAPHIFRNVGPTTDNSRDSRPEPDAFINFEDLMIYSLNYGNTQYLLKKHHQIMETQPINITIDEQHVSAKKNYILLTVENIPQSLKGIEITLNVMDPSQIREIHKGDLIKSNDFFIHESDENVIKVTYGNLNNHFAENGILATIEVDKCPGITLVNADVRDNKNKQLATKISHTETNIGSEDMYVRAYPNPFSEKTHFEVNAVLDGKITICIYDLHGRLVAQPANDYFPKGKHTFTWNGKDTFGNQLPDGIYFSMTRFHGSTINNRIILQH